MNDVGADAVMFWENTVRRDHRVAALNFFRYLPSQPLQHQLPKDGSEQAVILRADIRAKTAHVPFWDAVLLEAVESHGLTDCLIEAAIRCNPKSINRIAIDRQSILDGALQQLMTSAEKDEMTGIISEIVMDNGDSMHFPMLDFRINSDPSNLIAVRKIAKHLLPSGVTIFNSGRSFHIVGHEPVPIKKLNDFLISSLFFGSIVDRKYVAHHLQREFCTLRISASKNVLPPVVVCSIGSDK